MRDRRETCARQSGASIEEDRVLNRMTFSRGLSSDWGVTLSAAGEQHRPGRSR